MDEGLEASSVILKLLKHNPWGLTVSDVSRKLRYNRNSTAKHLEILTVEGKAEVRTVGAAKVYSVAQRIPLSAFLCFTKNMILILDTSGTIVQTNDQYLKFAGYIKKDLIGKNLLEASPPIVSSPEALAVIQSTANEQVITDIRYQHGKEDLFYQMEVIPTKFESGEKGLTIVLEDITERKRYVRNMEFLTRTAMELVNLPLETDIYEYIAEQMISLAPKGRVFVESYDEVNRQFFIRALLNKDFLKEFNEIVGRSVVGMSFPVQDFFTAPYNETIETFRPLREYHFKPYFEDELYSFYEVCRRQFPKEACEEIVRKYGIGRLYLIGLVWQEQLFGMVGIAMSPEEELRDKQAFESFIRQASIEIARRMTEERLSRSEKRLGDIVDLVLTPAAIIDPDGRYVHVNRQFTRTFGYTIKDIPRGKEWFARAFPDPDRRKEAIAAWKMDLTNAGQIEPRTFEVRCKSGENKTILFRPVSLSDGTQYVVYEDRTATD